MSDLASVESSVPATQEWEETPDLFGAYPRLTKDQIAKLDAASKVTLPYPYWHQRGTFSDRNPPPV